MLTERPDSGSTGVNPGIAVDRIARRADSRPVTGATEAPAARVRPRAGIVRRRAGIDRRPAGIVRRPAGIGRPGPVVGTTAHLVVTTGRPPELAVTRRNPPVDSQPGRGPR